MPVRDISVKLGYQVLPLSDTDFELNNRLMLVWSDLCDVSRVLGRELRGVDGEHFVTVWTCPSLGLPCGYIDFADGSKAVRLDLLETFEAFGAVMRAYERCLRVCVDRSLVDFLPEVPRRDCFFNWGALDPNLPGLHTIDKPDSDEWAAFPLFVLDGE